MWRAGERSWKAQEEETSFADVCIPGRGPPLPSIAQWIAGLFGNVDLSPSDLAEALILTAASQSLRRKMRIRKALEPLARASSAPSSKSLARTSATMSAATGVIYFSRCEAGIVSSLSQSACLAL